MIRRGTGFGEDGGTGLGLPHVIWFLILDRRQKTETEMPLAIAFLIFCAAKKD